VTEIINLGEIAGFKNVRLVLRSTREVPLLKAEDSKDWVLIPIKPERLQLDFLMRLLDSNQGVSSGELHANGPGFEVKIPGMDWDDDA
jgi:hypothetical protein